MMLVLLVHEWITPVPIYYRAKLPQREWACKYCLLKINHSLLKTLSSDFGANRFMHIFVEKSCVLCVDLVLLRADVLA